jgi:diaminohydroxyphosphoribosylaminopyrimidine deaminase/5-amino-6-(5-phosphoribosylamino)uracil reductase
MPESTDNIFMKRCLDLAVGAEGMTRPNPMVGSVVVHEGIIIGEGYHLKAGEPHAEVNAINSVADKSLLSRSTIYVSLEPCSHSGKTPPCADFIISSGIRRVVIGTADTSDKVSGKGISRLKSAGCDVISGVLDDECRRINRRFFTFHEKKRPYITLKWDIIRTGNESASPNWITGKPERVLVHKWRAQEEAILVGAATIRTDNPQLNVRYWKGNDPIKIILNGSGDLENYLFENETNGLIFAYNNLPGIEGAETGNGKLIMLEEHLPSCFQVTDYLYGHGIQSLFIEGGAKVFSHFIEYGLWDEARVFTGEVNFNEGIKAPSISGRKSYNVKFEKSNLRVLLND